MTNVYNFCTEVFKYTCSRCVENYVLRGIMPSASIQTMYGQKTVYTRTQELIKEIVKTETQTPKPFKPQHVYGHMQAQERQKKDQGVPDRQRNTWTRESVYNQVQKLADWGILHRVRKGTYILANQALQALKWIKDNRILRSYRKYKQNQYVRVRDGDTYDEQVENTEERYKELHEQSASSRDALKLMIDSIDKLIKSLEDHPGR